MPDISITGSLVIGGQDRPYATGPVLEAAARALHHRKDDKGDALSAAAYQKSFGTEALRPGPLTGADASDFVYSALVAGYTLLRLPIDFNHHSVELWLKANPEAAQPLWDAVAASLPPAKVATRPAAKANAKTAAK
jgi:hypothetical protein